MEHKSLKSLWEVVASCGRGKPANRRCETRLPAHGLMSIRLDVEGEYGHSIAVSLLGMSEHGISFRTSRPLGVGQNILVQPQNVVFQAFESFEAVVRHVEPDGQEFVIGAKIQSSDGERVPISPVAEQADQQ